MHTVSIMSPGANFPFVPMVHTCFARGIVFPSDISSKLMERRTKQVYVRASISEPA